MAKILLIDDEPDLRSTTRRLLEKAGHEVLEADSGDEGLGILKTERADLIFLDIMMPKMDGWEVLLRIKANENLKDIPVAMLSVKDSEEDILTSFKYDADLHIPIPFEENILLDAIEALLD